MDSNDLNRRVRYALMLDDADVAKMLSLAGFESQSDDIVSWRLKEGEEGYVACPPVALRAMLDGLIVERRGPREGDVVEVATPAGGTAAPRSRSADLIDNNEVLKQLRIALSLKSDDVHALIEQGGGKITKSEVGALFRKPAARNFRQCGDQVLRWFLAGLAEQRDDQ